jgi:tripartite-type tricarboxylate transporter receptor subunit TctC
VAAVERDAPAPAAFVLAGAGPGDVYAHARREALGAYRIDPPPERVLDSPATGDAAMQRRRLMLLIAALPLAARAQPADYPSRPVRVIVPFSPGGAVDGPMRAIAEQMGRRLKQQVIIENRPGAGATIGSEAIAKSAPDGYNLLLASQTNAISATLYAGRLAFNPIDDFAGISLLGREPGVLVVHPSLPANSIAELVALAKKEPGKLNYASSGNGSGQHLFMAMFASMSGIQIVHVPYKGSGQAINDLLAGTVPMAMPGAAAMVKHIRAGKLRALATTGRARAAQLPEVPTLAESGFPGYEAYVWMGLLAPKGTPRPIVELLQREAKAALATPEVAGYMNEAGIESVGGTPEQMEAFLREERDRWARIVKETGAKID